MGKTVTYEEFGLGEDEELARSDASWPPQHLAGLECLSRVNIIRAVCDEFVSNFEVEGKDIQNQRAVTKVGGCYIVISAATFAEALRLPNGNEYYLPRDKEGYSPFGWTDLFEEEKNDNQSSYRKGDGWRLSKMKSDSDQKKCRWVNKRVFLKSNDEYFPNVAAHSVTSDRMINWALFYFRNFKTKVLFVKRSDKPIKTVIGAVVSLILARVHPTCLKDQERAHILKRIEDTQHSSFCDPTLNCRPIITLPDPILTPSELFVITQLEADKATLQRRLEEEQDLKRAILLKASLKFSKFRQLSEVYDSVKECRIQIQSAAAKLQALIIPRIRYVENRFGRTEGTLGEQDLSGKEQAPLELAPARSRREEFFDAEGLGVRSGGSFEDDTLAHAFGVTENRVRGTRETGTLPAPTVPDLSVDVKMVHNATVNLVNHIDRLELELCKLSAVDGLDSPRNQLGCKDLLTRSEDVYFEPDGIPIWDFPPCCCKRPLHKRNAQSPLEAPRSKIRRAETCPSFPNESPHLPVVYPTTENVLSQKEVFPPDLPPESGTEAFPETPKGKPGDANFIEDWIEGLLADENHEQRPLDWSVFGDSEVDIQSSAPIVSDGSETMLDQQLFRRGTLFIISGLVSVVAHIQLTAEITCVVSWLG